MKILDTINGSIKKFGKGMLAIFTIKLLLFGGAFVIQSCQTDSIEDSTSIQQQLAVNDFKSLVINSKPKLDNYFNKKQSLSSKSSSINEENEMRNILELLLNGSKDLLHAYNFTDEQIKEEFGNLESPEVILSAVLIVALEKDKQLNTASNINFSDLFATSLYSQNYYDQTVDCVLRATGLSGAGVLLNEGIKEGLKKLGVKGTLKMVGKIAGRTLSWVGIAWAVADFAYCMSR